MAEYVNGTTDILGGSVIRYNLNTTTPNQAVIRKIIAGNGITISSTGVDAGTGDVTISIDVSGTGGSGGGTGGGGTGGGGGGTPTAVGTVTSVNMIVPEGLSVAGVPITTAGTIALQLSSGYTIPLYTDVEKGVIAYDNAIISMTYDPATDILTLNQRDGDGMIVPVRNIYNSDGTLTANRIVSSGGFTLTFNPKTFFDNGATFNASAGNVGSFINTHNYATNST